MSKNTCGLEQVIPTVVTWCYGFVYISFWVAFTISAYNHSKRIILDLESKVKQNANDSADESQQHTHSKKTSVIGLLEVTHGIEKQYSQSNVAASDMLVNIISEEKNDNGAPVEKVKNDDLIDKLYDESGQLQRKEFVKLWFNDVLQKRKCYLPLLTHTIDQMTDVGVIIAFYLLYQEELNKKDSNYCETINPLSLLILSVISFWFYRILTGVAIYIQTRSKIRLLLQLFDLELFRAIWVNYTLNSDRPTNPQRWIQSLEGIFEAFPQTLIQLFYVTKTNSINFLVFFSIIWSLWSIIIKTSNEDELFFMKKYQRPDTHCLSKKYWLKGKCISVWFVIRIGYRAGDIVCRVLILLLLWIFVGGFTMSCLVCVEMTCLVILAVVNQELSKFRLNLATIAV